MQDSNIKKLWHTNRKCFIEEFSILQTINSEGKCEHTYFEYNPKTKELEKLPTCQIKEIKCTGLKDKNGKLIYEGDIVKSEEYPFKRDDKYNYSAEICWSKETAQFFYYVFKNKNSEVVGRSTGNTGFLEEHDWEVLGNVYKNPELLEVNNADISP